MKTKKGDFIEIDYIAKIKDENRIFDLTNEETAKKEKIYNPNFSYKPLIICLGENHVISGLDSALIDKEVGKEYLIDIQPENGYGKKDARLIQLVSTNIFRKQNIKPMPGLQVQVDNLIGIIKTVTGGRTLIDFNHPLAGKVLEYKVNILGIVREDKNKIKAMLKIMLHKDIDFDFKESELKIKENLPEGIKKIIDKEIKRLVPSVKGVSLSK